jgi:hypothetical protein
MYTVIVADQGFWPAAFSKESSDQSSLLPPKASGNALPEAF